MIKGRYVATVEIDFSVSENEPYLLPFDEINKNLRNAYDRNSAVAYWIQIPQPPKE